MSDSPVVRLEKDGDIGVIIVNYPPVNALPTGTHSAVIVPNRPAQVRGNTKNRPAYVWMTDENGGLTTREEMDFRTASARTAGCVNGRSGIRRRPAVAGS